MHFFRILKLVCHNDDREQREVLNNDIKQFSIELGLENTPISASTQKPAPKPMNFADIFNPQNMNLIETAIKAITTNDKFNNIMQNLSSKDNEETESLSTSDLTSGVLEIMNAMKTEIPGILSTITPKQEDST